MINKTTSLIFLISFISAGAASLRQQTAVRCTKGELSYVCKGRGHFQGDSISTHDSRLGTSRHPGVCVCTNGGYTPQHCCNSLEASCDACKQRLSVRRFCRANPHYPYHGCERFIRPKRQWIPHRACLPSVTYRGRRIRGCAPPDSFTPDKTKWWCATNRPNLLGFLGNNWQYCTYD